jgi:hypothetical protein
MAEIPLNKDFDLTLDESGKVWCIERAENKYEGSFRVTDIKVLEAFQRAMRLTRNKYFAKRAKWPG